MRGQDGVQCGCLTWLKKDLLPHRTGRTTISALGLGVVLHDGSAAAAALEKAIELSSKTGEYNRMLLGKYGTEDGIAYAARRVVDECLTFT